MSLGWVYLGMGVLVGSAVLPITLTMTWTRLTGVGMCVGAIGGCIFGLVSWLVVSSFQPGGLTDFFASTGKNPVVIDPLGVPDVDSFLSLSVMSNAGRGGHPYKYSY